MVAKNTKACFSLPKDCAEDLLACFCLPLSTCFCLPLSTCFCLPKDCAENLSAVTVDAYFCCQQVT